MVFTPLFTPTALLGCEHRCEHLRHGRDLMSDRTSGAWSACSLHGLTAWTRPESTKWAVVVIFCARATNHGNEVFSVKLASRARAPSLTTTAHFVGSGRFQAVSSSREHALHAPDVRSDIRFGPWRRCSPLFTPTGVLPGVGHTVVSTCQHIVLNSRFRAAGRKKCHLSSRLMPHGGRTPAFSGGQ